MVTVLMCLFNVGGEICVRAALRGGDRRSFGLSVFRSFGLSVFRSFGLSVLRSFGLTRLGEYILGTSSARLSTSSPVYFSTILSSFSVHGSAQNRMRWLCIYTGHEFMVSPSGIRTTKMVWASSVRYKSFFPRISSILGCHVVYVSGGVGDNRNSS